MMTGRDRLRVTQRFLACVIRWVVVTFLNTRGENKSAVGVEEKYRDRFYKC